MAAALFFNGSLMFVEGIQIVANRSINLRASLIVGFSILSALSVMIFPEFYKLLPPWTPQFTDSEITLAVITSVLLNAVFLLGTCDTDSCRWGSTDRQRPQKPLTISSLSKRANGTFRLRTLRGCVRLWIEAIEQVSANAQGPVEILVGSDSSDVKVTLRYVGNLPSLPEARPKREVVEEQSFVSGLTGYLSGLHANRVERSAKGEECEIHLLFPL